MKRNKRIALLVGLVFILSCVPMTAMAASFNFGNGNGQGNYYGFGQYYTKTVVNGETVNEDQKTWTTDENVDPSEFFQNTGFGNFFNDDFLGGISFFNDDFFGSSLGFGNKNKKQSTSSKQNSQNILNAQNNNIKQESVETQDSAENLDALNGGNEIESVEDLNSGFEATDTEYENPSNGGQIPNINDIMDQIDLDGILNQAKGDVNSAFDQVFQQLNQLGDQYAGDEMVTNILNEMKGIVNDKLDQSFGMIPDIESILGGIGQGGFPDFEAEIDEILGSIGNDFGSGLDFGMDDFFGDSGFGDLFGGSKSGSSFGGFDPSSMINDIIGGSGLGNMFGGSKSGSSFGGFDPSSMINDIMGGSGLGNMFGGSNSGSSFGGFNPGSIMSGFGF
jgi:hypothetical protein